MSGLQLGPATRPTLRNLRDSYPGWLWRAERRGMGWTYVGDRGDVQALVYAAVVLPYGEDQDGRVEWYVRLSHPGYDFAVSLVIWRGVATVTKEELEFCREMECIVERLRIARQCDLQPLIERTIERFLFSQIDGRALLARGVRRHGP